ncbi:hypothetical protein TRVL_04971 [Trypanosoma vivax]|nr:hypothetical protein TRVL_04971 [Trypanosoma vivax]
MALVEPLVGHLLSKYANTVNEGLEKIRKCLALDEGFATEFLLHPHGLTSLQEAMKRREVTAPVLQMLTQLVKACTNPGVRLSVLRDMCRGSSFGFLRSMLYTLSDATLPVTLAALQFLAVVAAHIPKVLLSRFGNVVPLHLSCFRLQLPYSQRRVRLARAQLLVNLVSFPQANTTEMVLYTHGFLTHLLEDAAELLQEGTEAGVSLAKTVLQVFSDHFIGGRASPSRKRALLWAQKHIIRLLIKALDYPLASEYASNIVYRLVLELLESPADYQLMRVDADDKGMPNHLLFFILRHLKPRSSPPSSRLVVFILHQAPDLIRPYFTRLSSHLSHDGGDSHTSSSTATIATLNVMTRAMLAPVPYHLAAGMATLQPIEAKATSFFSMSPTHVVEEICPAWIAEYVHRLINGSNDLLMLSFAIQLTHAILTRAKEILRLVSKLQESQVSGTAEGADPGCEGSHCDWVTYNAKVQVSLMKAVPSREEFWHRMTQQLHGMMVPSGQRGAEWKPAEKVLFLSQRMFLLMELYGDVFHLRVPWLSAVPTFLPTFRVCPQPVEDALRRGEGVATNWPATSISALCSLLVSSLSRGVSMTKLHHITMSSPKGGVQEWPLLLSLMLWVVKRRGDASEETQVAVAWVARLLQWTVHSATVRFLCELEEAYAWLEALDESTLPCFLHMINNLLQRSLSKSADRVAQELVEGDCGVLVCAARTFVARFEEKSQCGEAVSKRLTKGDGGGGEASAPRRQRSQKKGEGGSSIDLWVVDMQEHLKLFKSVTERVAKGWSCRFQLMKESLPSLFSLRKANSGKRRIALAQLQTKKEHCVLQPVHKQVMNFCLTLCPPTLASEVEDELSLLSDIREYTKGMGTGALIQRLCKGSCPSVWCRYPLVCWELAAHIIRSLNAVGDEPGSEMEQGESELETVSVFCQSLLTGVVEDASATADVLLGCSHTEGNAVGFLFFLLVATHALLHKAAKHSPPSMKRTSLLSADSIMSLSGVVLRTYSGTVSTVDRIRYAVLLSLSYLQSEQSNMDSLPQKDHSHVVDEGVSDEVPENCGAGRASESHGTPGMKVFSGVLVPLPIAEARFVIMNHQCAPHLSQEVDMLSLIVDTWTEEEVIATALHCPARLHNTIRLLGKGNAGWGVLCCIFPEFNSPDEASLVSFDSITASYAMDPRYIVPLVHTVLAMPDEQVPRKGIGTKCIPILLRSLSFTDPLLRRMGATALMSVWKPSGATKIVVEFARLKLSQKVTGRGGHRDEKREQEGNCSTWNCVRLPSPVSAFLVMAQRALGDMDHPLHNDIMHFFLETKDALLNPVPLHRFLLSFPLACITTPIMIKRQETMQSKGERNSTVAYSAAKVLDQLRAEAPLHLPFIARLVQFGCQTCSDFSALLHTESLHALMMLISMAAASDDVRLMLLRSLCSICTTSKAVAIQAVTEGHVLQWLLGFTQQLIMEYGRSGYLYGEPLFMEVIQFVQRLSSVTRSLPLHGQQTLQHLELIRHGLVANCVTTKAVLDGVAETLRALEVDEKACLATTHARKRQAFNNHSRSGGRLPVPKRHKRGL